MWPAAWFGFRHGAAAMAWALGLAGLALLMAGRSATLVSAVLVLGAAAGALAHGADQRQLESLGDRSTSLRMAVRAAGDSEHLQFGSRVVVIPEAVEHNGAMTPWSGPRIAITAREELDVTLGDRLLVEGTVTPGAGRVGRVLVAGRFSNPVVERVGASTMPLVGVANGLRSRVLGHLDLADPGEALLAGFLVGDTSGVSEADLEALRRSGLTHYVAVSGSNVASFLALWWLALAPLARHPRLRAVSGLVGVLVFVLVTRAEPSVVRAGVMVSVLLVGRLAGWAFDRWTALALAVLGCLSISARLAADVGFQLSVAATFGVMAGTERVRFEPRAVSTVVGASLSAQVAVAPILLAVFGTLPALAPLANLVAAPMVAVSTMIGGVGATIGIAPMVSLGALGADAVLWVGRLAAPWPQLGPVGAGLIAATALLGWRFAVLRTPLVMVGAVVVAVAIVPRGPAVGPGSVVFMDVGQGDASLVVGNGATILIDGGPDPGILTRKLAELGVDRIDLLVVSHVHADHVEGLRAVVGRIPIGGVWLAFDHQSTAASDWLLEAVAGAGIPSKTPSPGTVLTIGDVRLAVLGPLRRYASPNDQSLVVEATAAGKRYLFSGDIEVIAQRELDGLTADVLKVPHQGAATSDPDWLAAVSAEVAVISVGPNDFGHPADWVIEVLESSGATVMRTDRDGDVVVGPAGLSSPDPWWRLWP